MGYQHFVALNDGSPCIPYPMFDGPTNQVVDSGNGVWIDVNALGAPPLNYQWQFNGIEIPGASSSSLTVTNVQDINAGPYTLVISNAKGRVVSSPQFLSVTNSPPRLAWEPYNKSVMVGSNVSFGLDAPFYHYGSRPQTYQWLFQGMNLPGATNLKLALTNVDSSDQGFYALVVSNAFGYATSSNAFLHVVSLPEALSATNLVWISGGDAPWFPVFDFGYNSRYGPLARSGIISNHQTSVLQTEVTGPGILDFWWRVTCEPTNDYLSFSISGVEQARITGSPWGSVPRFHLGTGKQTLLWAYVQNSIGAQYYARLDQVVFSPGTSPPTIATQPTDRVARSGDSPTLTVTAQGTPALRYQWQFNQSNIAGATNSALTLTNVQSPQGGKYRVNVTNDYGSTNSQDAVLLIDYVGLDHPKDALERWFFRDSLQLRRVRFVGGKFVAVGDNGSLATSVDGATWTSQNTGTAAHLGGVAYGDIWSPFPVPFAGKAYIVVGSAGTILYSTNGANWTQVATTHTCNLNDVAWNGSRFAAVATRSSASQPNVLVSFDGFDWEPTTFPTGTPQYGAYTASTITTVGSRFVTAGGQEWPYDIWRNVGAYSWTNAGSAGQFVSGIAPGGDRLLMVGWEGWPKASTNQGTSWFTVGDTNVCAPGPNSPFSFCMNGADVAYGNGTFVIARGFLADGLLTTTDHQTWNKRPVFLGRSIYSVAFGNGTFVALGSDGIFQSETVTTPVITASRDPNSNALQLSISGEIGRQYRLQTSSLASVWADRLTYTNASGNVIVVDPIRPETSRLFYRVVSP